MEQQYNNNDDVDLKQVLQYLKKFFITLINTIVTIILFYKRKWLQFVIILVVGGAIGYGLDLYLGNKRNYVQKVVIEPKYGSSNFIYDFIEEIKYDKRKTIFKVNLKLEKDDFKYLKGIEIEPIVVTTDLIEYFSNEVGQNDFYKVLEEYSIEDLTSKKFRDIYKHHLLTFTFSDDQKNLNLVDKVLAFLQKNKYYNLERKVKLEQAKSSIEENKKSLKFISEYLKSKQNENLKPFEKTILVSENLSTVTVATLLDKKEELIKRIDELKKVVELDQELFSIIDFGVRIYKPLPFNRRLILIMPVFLFLLVSIVYLLKSLPERYQKFTKD